MADVPGKSAGDAELRSPTDLVRDYIRAKDENRPHLIPRVFCESACLEMRVRNQDISFPPVSQGAATIADVLVRRFNQTYENIYTFCMEKPAAGSAKPPAVFACDWQVGMSEKATGNVRVGCGRYEWIFLPSCPPRVERLAITIEVMQTLPPWRLPEVLNWLLALDYPWTSVGAASRSAPAINLLDPVLKYLVREGGVPQNAR